MSHPQLSPSSLSITHNAILANAKVCVRCVGAPAWTTHTHMNHPYTPPHPVRWQAMRTLADNTCNDLLAQAKRDREEIAALKARLAALEDADRRAQAEADANAALKRWVAARRAAPPCVCAPVLTPPRSPIPDPRSPLPDPHPPPPTPPHADKWTTSRRASPPPRARQTRSWRRWRRAPAPTPTSSPPARRLWRPRRCAI